MTKHNAIKSCSFIYAIFFSFACLPCQGAEPKIDPEMEEALGLAPNLKRGRQLYETCAICHTPLGWGTPDGRYPQIAGQHYSVVIKQLEDIRHGNRDNPTMYPFTQPNILPDAQAIADVSGYIARMPMNPHNAVGPGNDLKHGAALYQEHCVKCHGEQGEGDAAEYYPRIQGQIYSYLLRQMFWIKNGKRRNADETMVRQIEHFSTRDMYAVIDYASRLRPADELLASDPGWRNPDFPADFRAVPIPHPSSAESP